MGQQEIGSGGADQSEDRGGSTPDRDPNDDRSDVMNPETGAHEADQANREEQARRGW